MTQQETGADGLTRSKSPELRIAESERHLERFLCNLEVSLILNLDLLSK